MPHIEEVDRQRQYGCHHGEETERDEQSTEGERPEVGERVEEAVIVAPQTLFPLRLALLPMSAL